MSEILARIRVRETHGIRRFLYQRRATVELPSDIDSRCFQFVKADGQPVPTETSYSAPDYTARKGYRKFQIEFAVSLDPHEEMELELQECLPGSQILDDPLDIQRTEEGGVESRQNRFLVTLTKNSAISQVVYDGIPYLRSPDQIKLNGFAAPEIWPNQVTGSHLFLNCWNEGQYPIEATQSGIRDLLSMTSLTACKSWAHRYYWIQEPSPYDEIVFTLPLAITSPTLTCDFGVGGYVFGKMDSKATEIVWRTEFGDAPYAKWTVATAGRVDYVGEVESAKAFLPQRWFHLIDSDKALAVAVTKLPEGCREMTVRLTIEGDVSIAFKLGDTVTGHAEFGVCYHFLNDVPAIAAATNPQSILLPPVVEVLPV